MPDFGQPEGFQRIRIATQNIEWGGDPRIGAEPRSRLPELAPYLRDLEADILVLTEYKSGEPGQTLRTLMGAEIYPYWLTPEVPPWKLGTAIASRFPISSFELPIPSAAEPWRSSAVMLDRTIVVGLYFPLDQPKGPYWEWVLANAALLRDQDVLLAGDFNTGKHWVDEERDTIQFAEKMDMLEALGYRDCWRAENPTERGATWFSSAGNGFRLDCVWSSASISSRVTRVSHNHTARLAGATDHAAVVVELSYSDQLAEAAHS